MEYPVEIFKKFTEDLSNPRDSNSRIEIQKESIYEAITTKFLVTSWNVCRCC